MYVCHLLLSRIIEIFYLKLQRILITSIFYVVRCTGDVDDIQRRHRFTQKVRNWWRVMGIWLSHWNQNPFIPMEASRRDQDRKKTRQVRSNVKVLLTVFFNCNRMVHREFLPQGRTVNKEYYLEVKLQWRNRIVEKPIMNFASWYRTSSHIIACA